VLVDGISRDLCCAGCEAAAQLILSQGLGRYYQFRSPAEPLRDQLHPSWQYLTARRRSPLQPPECGWRARIELYVEGMHCSGVRAD